VLKTEPLSGWAPNVTTAPGKKFASQVGPQLIPTGLLVTDPLPDPAFVIANRNSCRVVVVVVDVLVVEVVVVVVVLGNVDVVVVVLGIVVDVVVVVVVLGLVDDVVVVLVLVVVVAGMILNVAVQFLFAVIETRPPALLQPVPVHPVKIDPDDGLAIKSTVVSRSKGAEAVEQPVGPQSIPAGLVLTVPVPVPDFVKVRRNVSTKVAMTVFAPSMVTVQVPIALEQASDHSVNLEPGAEPVAVAAVAVRVTWVLKLL
jgi:hypothetical protein